MTDTVLYVAYWGLREPLGRSLILPAVREMARRGMRVNVISFEKARDLEDQAGVQGLQRELQALGVRWHPLRYHKRPTVPATLFDVVHGLVVGLTSPRPSLIHGRTFVGGVIGAVLGFLRRAPFVYHNEGFWPDQQVEGGFWPPGGFLYRVTKGIEHWLYGRANGLILLSRRSLPVVAAMPNVIRRKAPVAIVPSSVDLDRFTCGSRTSPGAGVRLVYVGSLGGRYMIEPLGHLLAALRRLEPESTLLVLSHSDHPGIERALRATAAPPESWTLAQVAHEEVPRHLNQADAGIFFLKGGIGAESCSPTKVGEYWACGLPVVANSGIGDVDATLLERRVGLLLDDFSAAGYERAATRLVALLRDTGLRERCRKAAEEHYALGRAVSDQLDLYRAVLAVGGAAS
jgi:glycosyltransferase involved in cell wall biosynthesis